MRRHCGPSRHVSLGYLLFALTIFISADGSALPTVWPSRDNSSMVTLDVDKKTNLRAGRETKEPPSSRRLQQVQDSRPELGDPTTQLEVGKEEVVIGQMALEGVISPDVLGDLNVCAKKTLADIALIPTYYIRMSVTPEFSPNHKQAVVKFHFVLLPMKGTSVATAKAIMQSSLSDGSAPAFLIGLTRNMRDVDSLSSYYVIGLQFAIRIPQPEVQGMEIWREPGYPSSGGAGPTTLAPAEESTTTPNADACLTIYSPCDCASLGLCAWVEDPATGISSCAKSTYGSNLVACAACPAQARCLEQGCVEIRDPCDCAASAQGCRWDEGSNSCQKGAGTSCAACAKQTGCAASVPKVISFMPLSGSYLRPHQGTQKIQLGFNKAIQFISGSTSGAAFHCSEQVVPIAISRPRMVIENNYLILDVSALGTSSALSGTNNARRCSLVIGEGLVSDTYGIPFLGLRYGQYSVDFGDTVPPEVLLVHPKNGATDVGLNPVVKVTFSEPVEVGPAAKIGALKIALGELRDADLLNLITEIELTDPSVKLLNSEMEVDLKGFLEHGKRYTVSLPYGSVVDIEQNIFQGLKPLSWIFETRKETAVYKMNSNPSGEMPLTTLFAFGTAITIVLGVIVFVVWRVAIFKASMKMKAAAAQQQQQAQRLSSKSQDWITGGSGQSQKAHVIDTGGRSPSVRASLSASFTNVRSSASTVVPEEDMKGTKSAAAQFRSFADDDERPKVKRSETCPPGMMPTTPQMSEAPQKGFGEKRLGSKERSSKERSDPERDRSKDSRPPYERKETVGSVKEAATRQHQQHMDARKRWQEAFAAASAKHRASPTSAPQPDRRRPSRQGTMGSDKHEERRPSKDSDFNTTTTSDAFNSTTFSRASSEFNSTSHSKSSAGPRTAGDGSRDAAKDRAAKEAPAPSPTGMPKADGRSQSKRDSRSKPPPSPSAGGSGGASGSSAGAASSPPKAFAATTDEDPEFSAKKKVAQKKLREMMDQPIDVRKKAFKELLFEYHPDKNADRHATQVFQFINGSKTWFLHEKT